MSSEGKWRTLLKTLLKGPFWKWMKATPGRSAASEVATIMLGLGITVFAVERILLKSRIHFGIFVPEDEKFKGKFLETLSSQKLQNVLSPKVNVHTYSMIAGEIGIGKTTAVKHTADRLGHRGIVYVQVPENGDPKQFEDSLAGRLFLNHLVHDKFFTYVSAFTAAIWLDFPDYDGNKKASYLSIIMKNLCVLSEQFKRWHGGKGIVLVIDQVEHFSRNKEGMKYLEVLQDMAKKMAVSDIFLLNLLFSFIFSFQYF